MQLNAPDLTLYQTHRNVLSDSQVQQYRELGYVGPLDLLSETEAAELYAAFLQRLEAKQRTYGVSLRGLMRFPYLAREVVKQRIPTDIALGMSSRWAKSYFRGRPTSNSDWHIYYPEFLRIAMDERLASIARQVLGEDPKLYRQSFHYKQEGDGTGWHVDSPFITSNPARNVFIWMALTHANETNSFVSLLPRPLSAIVGEAIKNNKVQDKITGTTGTSLAFSPLLGGTFLDAAGNAHSVAAPHEEEKAAKMILKPGQVFVFANDIVHAASPSRGERLGVTFRYTAASERFCPHVVSPDGASSLDESFYTLTFAARASNAST